LLLIKIYPEINWNIFTCRKTVPRGFWDSAENKRKFIEKIRRDFDIKSSEEWSRISREQIFKFRGAGVLSKTGNLRGVLRDVFPNQEWRDEKFMRRNKKARQRWLTLKISEIFENFEVIEDFKNTEISKKAGLSVEIDIFIPELKLGFEYQGEHHFEETQGRDLGLLRNKNSGM